MNVFKIAVWLEKGNKGMFDIPLDEQYAYMDSLGEPKDDIDRSYKQFQCQLYFWPVWKKILWWPMAVLVIPVALLLFWVQGLGIKFERQVDTIGEDKHMDEIIPEELSSAYDIDHKAWHAGAGLTGDDLCYIFRKVLGRRQPYFIMKSILFLTPYSARIKRFNPKRFIIHNEFSFNSSLLTDYCHWHNVEVINVQHGEKLRYIRDSFFHFDRCYVWNQHYVDILSRQKAEPTQFREAVPPSLKIEVSARQNSAIYADYKYYLAFSSEEEIKGIVASLEFAKREGRTVKFRPHPRYTDMSVLQKYVGEQEIEDVKNVGILESISNMEYAVGSYSTVLLQAHFSGKRVLLDDVTYKSQYNQLQDYGYILSDNLEGVGKLSEMQ